MDLKKILTGIAVKEAANKILPMDAPAKPGRGRLVTILGAIAVAAAALAEYLSR